MDEGSNIRMKMGILLREMYELGKEDGYAEAMKDFSVPDL
jgi:hypothetical protein